MYFFSTRLQIDQKWGTPQPITIRDKDFGAVRLRAFGNYAFRIADPKCSTPKSPAPASPTPWPRWTGSCAAWCCKTSATPLPAAACRSPDLAANQIAFANALAQNCNRPLPRSVCGSKP